eukprot:2612784-Pleurochrysis_carterae.AAC.1
MALVELTYSLTGHVVTRTIARSARTMATHSGERASKKFWDGAREAAAGLERAVRAAKQAAGGTTELTCIQPPPVQWAALCLTEWKKLGALSLWSMREGGKVLFTRARDVARADTDAQGRERIMVRLFEAGGEEAVPIFMPAAELIMKSDAAIAGVLYYNGRRGAAVPSLRVGREAVTLSPSDGMPLVVAVELACGGDDPQEVPLEKALAALKLEWQPTGQARQGAASRGAGDGGDGGERDARDG